ncbi:MAG TPA: MFS transporter, partial [Reyranellaceae bacterium]|nr:MFS transporter [Reyranellaceae bacterium]
MSSDSSLARRVLVYSSAGHGLMHLITAFYAVIVVTGLAIEWNLPAEQLLALYAPATILLGVMSLPAGWASDRFGAPVLMVVMFLGMGVSSIACGLVPMGDTWALAAGLCGLGAFGAIYHSVGIGWIIRTAKEQGHAMGVNSMWGSAGLALYGVVPMLFITLMSWRAAFIVPGVICVALGIALWIEMRLGRVTDKPMAQTRSRQTGRSQFWRVFTVLSVTMALEGVIWQAVLFGSALSFEEHFGRNILLIGSATSLIYVVSGIASYFIGRRIIDRYPLKSIYVASSLLQIGAMLA